ARSGARGSSGTSIVSDGTGLARYTATGALDPTFGSQGVVAQAFPASAPASPTIAAVAVDTAGRIVVAGSHTDGSSVDVDVARLTSAGTPDTAFAGGATASLAAAIPVGVAISADGRIVVWTVSGEAMAWLDDGTVDSSLGALPVVDLGVEGTVLGGMLDANDRLVVVGITTDTTPSTWFVRRYVL
ncbi:MAG: hypothetical protein FWD17_15015, partial [Polyangiaceae bacterium]|nr:hypothetical protein [Polyangiaceae bacterium]